MKTKFMMVGLLAAGSLLMGQKVKSPKEGEAVQAVLSATTPDQKIAAVDNLLSQIQGHRVQIHRSSRWPAKSYQQKGDCRQRHRIRKSRDRSRSQELPGHAAGFRPARADAPRNSTWIKTKN